MAINRYPGKAFGRSKSVEHNGIVYTVVTAPDVSADLRARLNRHSNSWMRISLRLEPISLVSSVTIYITDMSKKPILNAVWDAWIGADNWPQRACVEVKLEGDTLWRWSRLQRIGGVYEIKNRSIGRKRIDKITYRRIYVAVIEGLSRVPGELTGKMSALPLLMENFQTTPISVQMSGVRPT